MGGVIQALFMFSKGINREQSACTTGLGACALTVARKARIGAWDEL